MYGLAIITGLLVVILDLVLKSAATEVVFNYGVALGIGAFLGLVWTIIHIIILIGVFWWIRYKSTDLVVRNLLVFIIIVSLSNLFDRIAVNAVRDYIDLLGIWLNLADVSLFFAIIALLYANTRSNLKTK